MSVKVAFIGGGNMARSIIGGLINNGHTANDIIVSDPNLEQCQALKQDFGIQIASSNNQALSFADAVVLAVKPQIMAAVCEELTWQGQTPLFISIAAGISIERLQSILGESTPIIRTMPNTPALIGRGMTGIYAAESVTTELRDIATMLMAAVGEVCWLEKEDDINYIIAAAGSAPAYFFLFMEAMQDYAQHLGFSEQQARLLVQQSALGSAEMVIANPELDLATLRQNVTSKGGTTAQAIESFEEHGLRTTVERAMQAAIDRGREMETLF